VANGIKFKEDGQCTYNVTLRSVRVTIVAVRKHIVLNILSVCLYTALTCSACKSHLFCAVLYCHIWPVRLYPIFPHYLIYVTIFGKQNLLNIIYLQLMPETFLILRRIHRDFIMNIHWSSYKVSVFLVGFLVKIGSFSTYFRNSLFHENSSSTIRVVSWGLTDGRTDRQTLRSE
jgi:hypothetical protein